MQDAHAHLQRLLTATRWQLRSRRALRGSIVGAYAGLGIAITAALLIRMNDLASPLLTLLAIGLFGLSGSGIGGLVGWLRPWGDDRAVALIADRAAQSDEAMISALHASQLGSGNEPNILAHVQRFGADRIRHGLPVRLPPSARWLAVAVLVAALVVWIPPIPFASSGVQAEPTARSHRKDNG